MRRVLGLLAVLSCTIAAYAEVKLPSNVEKVETFGGITQYRLRSNGMPILLVPNHASPVFTFMVVYHVGSRNEAPGNTGSAHLLEHMIFNKSTENFGRAKGHKTFQEVLYEAGADFSSTNMTTWYDRMNGYSTLPADKLELAMKIEADRLGRALILDSERQSEMSVVRNEFEIGENNPIQALYKSVVGSAIQAHPYHWSTIGYRSDIEGVTTEKLREHYRNFFWPNNAQAILVGDFDPQKALEIFAREFGAFEPSPDPIPEVITVEPPQEGERRTIVKRPGTVSLVMLGYIRPGALHPDFIPLEVLGTILAEGVNSRLHQSVVETQLATDVSALNFTLRDPFPLLVFATVAPGQTPEKVEESIKATLYAVAGSGVSEDELRRAKQQIESSVIRSRDGTYQFTSALGEAVASADWKWFLTYVDRVNAVTAEDVKRVAATYLVPDRATVGYFVPAAAAATAATAPEASKPAAPTQPRTPVQQTKAAPSSSGSFAQRTTRKVLANGIIVDVVENRANPTVAIRGLVFAGDSTSPAGQPSLADLTARMLQRGTTKRTKEQIATLLDGAGATRSYGTNLFEATLSLNGLSRDLPLLVEVLADELKNPRFAPDELTKAKSELRTTVLRNDDATLFRAMERLTQLVYVEGHPYRSAGRAAMEASIEAVSPDDLRAFHQARYTGSNLILAIVGDVDAKSAIALVEKHLGNLAKGQRLRMAADPTKPAEKPVHEVVNMPGKANVNMVLGSSSGLRRADPDYDAARIANAALGQNALSSRIGRRVRDTEGLSYNLFSRYDLSDALDGIWYLNVAVAPQNVAKALRSTREEIAKFAREGITEEEVQIQKNFFAGNFQVGLSTNAGVASALVTAEKFGFGPGYLDEFPARMRAVTREEVNEAIRKRFHPDRLHLIIAGALEEVPE